MLVSLQEFDAVIDRMKLAFEYAESLGQFPEAARVLFQINDQLPEDLQIGFDGLDDPSDAKPFVRENYGELKTAIAQYRERLMTA